MKKIGEYLKARREAKDMSFRDAAKATGISHVHVKDIEDGKTMPTFDKVMKLLKAYHADVQEFLQETGYLPPNIEPAPLGKLRKIPIISWVMAGKWEAVCDHLQPGEAEEWIEIDVKGSNVFAVRVKGDSMIPEFNEGEIAVINPHLEVRSGDYVVVKNDDEEATFKQFKVYGDTTILHPLNPKYPDIVLKKGERYHIVGKVVKKVKVY
jgi:SOS-response transcriptional repressor LexA